LGQKNTKEEALLLHVTSLIFLQTFQQALAAMTTITSNYAKHVAKYVAHFMDQTSGFLEQYFAKREENRAAGWLPLSFTMFTSPYVQQQQGQGPPTAAVLSSASITDGVDDEGSRVLMFLIDVIANPPSDQHECALAVLSRKVKEQFGPEFEVVPRKQEGVDGCFILDLVWDRVKYATSYVKFYSRSRLQPPHLSTPRPPRRQQQQQQQQQLPAGREEKKRERRRRRKKKRASFDKEALKQDLMERAFKEMPRDPGTVKAVEEAIASGHGSIALTYYVPKYERCVKTKKNGKEYREKHLVTPRDKTYYELAGGSQRDNRYTPSYTLMFRGRYSDGVLAVNGCLPNNETMLDVLKREFASKLTKANLDLCLSFDPSTLGEDGVATTGTVFHVKVIDPATMKEED
jgi:hypothetical protein